jgi:hypothetical protein
LLGTDSGVVTERQFIDWRPVMVAGESGRAVGRRLSDPVCKVLLIIPLETKVRKYYRRNTLAQENMVTSRPLPRCFPGVQDGSENIMNAKTMRSMTSAYLVSAP